MDLLVTVGVVVPSPMFEESPATAATVTLYLVPGIKPLIIKLVSLVMPFSSMELLLHRIMYEVVLPSGSVQVRDTDDVVTTVSVRLFTTAGSGKMRGISTKQHVVYIC